MSVLIYQLLSLLQRHSGVHGVEREGRNELSLKNEDGSSPGLLIEK